MMTGALGKPPGVWQRMQSWLPGRIVFMLCMSWQSMQRTPAWCMRLLKKLLNS
jgi:hypothetical protein